MVEEDTGYGRQGKTINSTASRLLQLLRIETCHFPVDLGAAAEDDAVEAGWVAEFGIELGAEVDRGAGGGTHFVLRVFGQLELAFDGLEHARDGPHVPHAALLRGEPVALHGRGDAVADFDVDDAGLGA